MDDNIRRALGRYEFYDAKSSKFWSIRKGEYPGEYIATWGAIDTGGKDTLYQESDVLKKVREKLTKGYIHMNTDESFDKAREILGKVKVKAEAQAPFNFLEELKKV